MARGEHLVLDSSGRRPANVIALETSLRREIPNEQLQEVSRFELRQHAAIDARYGRWIQYRSQPTPRYNCHGMTFASRRTGIFESWVIEWILYDDAYAEIQPRQVLPGDVALYFAADGDIEHSAIVVESPESAPLSIPLVYSKWGKFAEVLHRANRCPYHVGNIRYFRVLP